MIVTVNVMRIFLVIHPFAFCSGVIVKASGIPYHVGCFKCDSCGMNLKQKGE